MILKLLFTHISVSFFKICTYSFKDFYTKYYRCVFKFGIYYCIYLEILFQQYKITHH